MRKISVFAGLFDLQVPLLGCCQLLPDLCYQQHKNKLIRNGRGKHGRQYTHQNKKKFGPRIEPEPFLTVFIHHAVIRVRGHLQSALLLAHEPASVTPARSNCFFNIRFPTKALIVAVI